MTGVRRGATWIYRVLTLIWFAGAIVQFFLAGLGIFGINSHDELDDQSSLDPHRAVGSILWPGALLIFLIVLLAWPKKNVIGWYGLFLVFDVIQDPLAWAGTDTHFVGGLHALNGLILLALSGILARRAWEAMSSRRGPAPAPA